MEPVRCGLRAAAPAAAAKVAPHLARWPLASGRHTWRGGAGHGPHGSGIPGSGGCMGYWVSSPERWITPPTLPGNPTTTRRRCYGQGGAV